MSDLPAILGGTAIRPQGPPDWPPRDPAVADALQTLIASGDWGRYFGPWCEQFQSDLAAYHSCEHVILCSSGTVAVELALRGLGVGSGDEVVMAAYDFKGNFQDILAVGATPVLVDIRPDDWNLNVGRVAAAISPSTKAILISHLHGGIVDLPALREIADPAGLPIIEDACQMPGARVYGRRAGMWGDVGVLSFGGSKLLSAGRGGALLTDRADIVQRCRLYSHRGNESFPLSELQAAVLIPQLARLDERNRIRSTNAAQLRSGLRGQSGLAPLADDAPDSAPGYYKFGLQYDPEAFDGLSRDRFAAAMQAEGIAVFPGLRAVHRIHSRRRYRVSGELTHADDADERVLTLHHPLLLEEPADIDQFFLAVDRIRTHATLLKQQLPHHGE